MTVRRRGLASPRRSLEVVAVGLCGGLALASCTEETPEPVRWTAPRASASVPADRLAPGELEESAASAFGLAIPTGMRIDRRFHDVIFAVGAVTPEAVANFVRARIDAGVSEVGAARTVFTTARIRAGDPKRLYRVEVIGLRGTTRLEVRDITPVPGPVGLSEEERWRRAGFGPDGSIDPNLR